MKNLLFYLLIGLLATLTSCFYDNVTGVIPTENITIEEFSYADFDEIHVTSAFDAQVTFDSTAENIQIEANENLHQYIVVHEENNILTIRVRNNVNIRGNSTLRAYVTTDHLETFEVSGASSVTLQNDLVTDGVSIRMSGASSFLGTLDVLHADVTLSGASALDLSGFTEVLNINVSGASVFGSFDMVADELEMVLSGASTASLTVNESIDIVASGASSLNYKGDAVITRLEVTEASSINKVD